MFPLIRVRTSELTHAAVLILTRRCQCWESKILLNHSNFCFLSLIFERVHQKLWHEFDILKVWSAQSDVKKITICGFTALFSFVRQVSPAKSVSPNLEHTHTHTHHQTTEGRTHANSWRCPVNVKLALAFPYRWLPIDIQKCKHCTFLFNATTGFPSSYSHRLSMLGSMLPCVYKKIHNCHIIKMLQSKGSNNKNRTKHALKKFKY